MIDKDEIEVEVMSEDEFEIKAEDVSEANQKKGIGFLPVLFLTCLAAILGAVGGSFGTQYLVPQDDMSAEFSKINRNVNRSVEGVEQKTQKDIQTLRTEIENLQRQLKVIANDETASTLVEELSVRVEGLEAAIPSEIAAIDPETLTALNKAQADGFVWPDLTPIEQRLDKLADEAGALNQKVESLSLETAQLQEINTQSLDVIIAPTSIPTEFPKAKLMLLAESQKAPQGFLSRTLNKHITVKDPSDPSVLIDQVAKAAQAKNYVQAVEAFDKLPENIRSAGQEWRKSVELD